MVSILDQMTQGIMSNQKQKGVKLTPTADEVHVEPATVLPAATTESFPNDRPLEAIHQATTDIRRQIGYLLEALDAIDAVAGKAPAVEAVPDPVKIAEQEGDRKAKDREEIADRVKRLEAEAQAAVFTALDAPTPEPQPALPGGWTCPVHGDEALVQLESRKGRKYTGCTKCEEFEK